MGTAPFFRSRTGVRDDLTGGRTLDNWSEKK